MDEDPILRLAASDPMIANIQSMEVAITCLPGMATRGIIEHVGTAYRNMTEAVYKVKEEFVKKYHDNEIQHVCIKGRGWVWQTHCKFGGKKRPRYTRKEDLIDYLYNVYADCNKKEPDNFSFEAIFEAALALKIATERPKASTIAHYRSSFNRFVTKNLAKQDVRTLSPSSLKEYMLDIVISKHLTKKGLYKMKGILNLVYDYICDPERAYVSTNPVTKNNKALKKRCSPLNNRPENKAFQPAELEALTKELWRRVSSFRYDINAYAMLFSRYTGVREGEIPAIKWADVDFKRRCIHIHAQQNETEDAEAEEVKTSPYTTRSKSKKTIYYFNPTTKNEKGESQDGRYIPMWNEVERLLHMLSSKQKELGISSEWVFCKLNGDWILKSAYYSALYRLTREKLGLAKTNNHAFRISLNSYVLIPAGLNVAERAKILGHSVETNLRHYTFSKGDDYLREITQKLDTYAKEEALVVDGTPAYPTPMAFRQKEKAPERRIHKAFS